MKTLITAFTLILLINNLRAQDQMWSLYSNSENITAIAEEGDFLWIGTSSGLIKMHKIDGSKTFYDIFNSGMPNNWVTAIAISPIGMKWIGTNSGITSFDGNEWITLSNPLNSEKMVLDIAATNDGRIWVVWNSCTTYAGYGLFSFDGSDWESFSSSNSFLPSNNISEIETDREGLLWICTYDKGIASFDGENFICYNNANSGLPGDNVYNMSVDKNNTKWFACATYHDWFLVSYNGKAWQYNDINELDWLSPNFTVDTAGTAWFPGGLQGIYSFDGITWTLYNYSNYELLANEVHSATSFDNCIKWIGTNKRLISFDDIKWEYYNTSGSGIPGNSIYSIIHKDGHLWIATGDGLGVFDGNEWQVYDTSNTSLPSHTFYDMAFDSSGKLWLGSYNGQSLASFDGSNWDYFDTINSPLESYFIKEVEVDNDGIVWLGGLGLYSFDGLNWAKYNYINSDMPYDYINTLAVTPNGTKWLATYPEYKGGITSYNGSVWTTYNYANSGLPCDSVNQIAVDSKGVIWIATTEGIVQFDGSQWNVYDTTNSDLPVNNIVNINIDRNDNKWFVYREYLSNGQYREGFGSFDGVNWLEFKQQKFLPTCFASEDTNHIWMGTNYGLVFYDKNGSEMSKPERLFTREEIGVFPNPARSQIVFESQYTGILTLFSIDGQLIHKEIISEPRTTIDISMHPRGLYVLKHTSTSKIRCLKLIKQ